MAQFAKWWSDHGKKKYEKQDAFKHSFLAFLEGRARELLTALSNDCVLAAQARGTTS